MADVFVWSGAGGLNDGSKWEDAYTTLAKDWGAEAGFTPATDYIYVRDSHSEASATTLTLTGSTPEGSTASCRILCVVGADTGTSPGNLSTGAVVSTNNVAGNIFHEERLYIYGVNFLSENNINVGQANRDHDLTLEQCRLELTGTNAGDTINLARLSAGSGMVIRLIDVTIDFAAAAQGLSVLGGTILWQGGSVAFDVSSLIESQNQNTTVIFRGVDFSAMTSSNLVTTATINSKCRLIFSRCLLPTGGTIASGNIDVPGARIESYHCQIGTDADPAYQLEVHDNHGKVVTDTARYRTGGAKDTERTNPISWDMDTTVGTVREWPGHALESPPITAWADGDASTAHTYRIYFASDATIQDDDFWVEFEGPNDAATNSMSVFNTTRVAPRGTPANYTADAGSSWTGAGVGTKQYAEVSYTPDKPGPITARCFMAVASDNIYVDPVIVIDP
jgi:hypothetical protein